MSEPRNLKPLADFDFSKMQRQIDEDKENMIDGMVFQERFVVKLIDRGLAKDRQQAEEIMQQLTGLMIEFGYAMVSTNGGK